MSRNIEQIKEYISKYFEEPEVEHGMAYGKSILFGMRTDYEREHPDVDDENDDDSIELSGWCETEEECWHRGEEFVNSVKAKRMIMEAHPEAEFLSRDKGDDEHYKILLDDKVIGKGSRIREPKSFKCPWLDALKNLKLNLDSRNDEW